MMWDKVRSRKIFSQRRRVRREKKIEVGSLPDYIIQEGGRLQGLLTLNKKGTTAIIQTVVPSSLFCEDVTQETEFLQIVKDILQSLHKLNHILQLLITQM